MAKNKAPQTSFEFGVIDLFSESLNEPQNENMSPVDTIQEIVEVITKTSANEKADKNKIKSPAPKSVKSAPSKSTKSAKIAPQTNSISAKDALELFANALASSYVGPSIISQPSL